MLPAAYYSLVLPTHTSHQLEIYALSLGPATLAIPFPSLCQRIWNHQIIVRAQKGLQLMLLL